jgi:hypothetical protein
MFGQHFALSGQARHRRYGAGAATQLSAHCWRKIVWRPDDIAGSGKNSAGRRLWIGASPIRGGRSDALEALTLQTERHAHATRAADVIGGGTRRLYSGLADLGFAAELTPLPIVFLRRNGRAQARPTSSAARERIKPMQNLRARVRTSVVNDSHSGRVRSRNDMRVTEIQRVESGFAEGDAVQLGRRVFRERHKTLRVLDAPR